MEQKKHSTSVLVYCWRNVFDSYLSQSIFTSTKLIAIQLHTFPYRFQSQYNIIYYGTDPEFVQIRYKELTLRCRIRILLKCAVADWIFDFHTISTLGDSTNTVSKDSATNWGTTLHNASPKLSLIKYYLRSKKNVALLTRDNSILPRFIPNIIE